MGLRSVRQGRQSNARALCTAAAHARRTARQAPGQLKQVGKHQRREARGNGAFDRERCAEAPIEESRWT